MGEETRSSRITRLLLKAADHPPAAEELLPLVYQQLRAAAQMQMAGERSGHTLQPTALVHEAFLKLVGDRDLPWQNRRHFYAAAAEAMRQILLDHARTRGRIKRGGDRRHMPLNVVNVAESWDFEETLSLHDALGRLEEQDSRIAEIVRLRFYAGLSIKETARAVDISPATVKRRWEFGRTWLFRELRKGACHDGS